MWVLGPFHVPPEMRCVIDQSWLFGGYHKTWETTCVRLGLHWLERTQGERQLEGRFVPYVVPFGWNSNGNQICMILREVKRACGLDRQ